MVYLFAIHRLTSCFFGGIVLIKTFIPTKKTGYEKSRV